ncbi:MAG: LCP family protein, partial [Clostridia bacterium]|nr:LCP family protein [Clostridia bacterium]
MNGKHLKKQSSEEKQVEKATDVKKKKNARIVISTLFVFLSTVLLLFGMITGVIYHFYSLMDTGEDDFDYRNAVSVADEDREEVIGNNVELPQEDIYSDSNVMNLLLIGTDERTEEFDPYARADSIMVLSLNKKTHAVKLVSLERGMTVSMPGNKYDLLTHTFHYGGAKLVMQTVRTHFNLDTERYIRVNFSVFEKLIDLVGGVDITLTAEEAAALNLQSENKVKEGDNHLDGHSALQYARLRRIDSDWYRIKRQRRVIASIKNSMRNQSVGELNTIV